MIILTLFNIKDLKRNKLYGGIAQVRHRMFSSVTLHKIWYDEKLLTCCSISINVTRIKDFIR